MRIFIAAETAPEEELPFVTHVVLPSTGQHFPGTASRIGIIKDFTVDPLAFCFWRGVPKGLVGGFFTSSSALHAEFPIAIYRVCLMEDSFDSSFEDYLHINSSSRTTICWAGGLAHEDRRTSGFS